MESGTIAWSKLIQLGVPLAFDYRFRPERFHTLKIESDFFSRQGHCTLCWTGVYQSLLLKENQRRSCFYFLTKRIKFTWNSISRLLVINWHYYHKNDKNDFIIQRINFIIDYTFHWHRTFDFNVDQSWQVSIDRNFDVTCGVNGCHPFSNETPSFPPWSRQLRSKSSR